MLSFIYILYFFIRINSILYVINIVILLMCIIIKKQLIKTNNRKKYRLYKIYYIINNI